MSLTRKDRRTFIALFKDSRLIWAGRQPVNVFTENVKRTESPKQDVKRPTTITEIVTVQGWPMSNFVAIQNTAMPVVEYQGKRLVTFAMIDKVHGHPKGTAKRAFSYHRKHFVLGEDYVLLPASLKNEFRTLGISVPNRGLTTLTESGYLLIVKSFTDALSWDVQKQLVNIYFRRNTLGELRHVEIPSFEELREMPAEKAQHLVAKAEKESSFGHGKPGSAAMTLRRKELKQIRPAIRILIDLYQISICDLGNFYKGVAHG